MTFKISIVLGSTRYVMDVDRFYVGDSIDKYKISAGERSIELQSTIPEIQRTRARKRVQWKILKGDFKEGNIEQNALAIQRVFREIEQEIMPSKRPYSGIKRKDDSRDNKFPT